jgi:hypothetical protein
LNTYHSHIGSVDRFVMDREPKGFRASSRTSAAVLGVTSVPEVADRVVRRSQPGPGEHPVAGAGAGAFPDSHSDPHPALSRWERVCVQSPLSPRQRVAEGRVRVLAFDQPPQRKRPGSPRPGSAQNSTISRTTCGRSTIIRNGRRPCCPARPSPPLRYVSCSPGGRGTRRNHSAGALSPRGMMPRKPPATRPVFWKNPHRGPGEGTDGTWPGCARTLWLPFEQGRKDIIGRGFWIVSGFCPDFSRSQEKKHQDQVTKSARRQGSVVDSALLPRRAGGPLFLFRPFHAIHTIRSRIAQAADFR